MNEKLAMIKKIKIGLYDHDLILEHEHVNLEGSLLYGEIFHDDFEIYISTKYNELRQKETIIHECVHGFDVNRYIGLDERQITTISKEFLEFIKNNKDLVEYIMEDEK